MDKVTIMEEGLLENVGNSKLAVEASEEIDEEDEKGKTAGKPSAGKQFSDEQKEKEQLLQNVIEEWKGFEFRHFFTCLFFSVLPAFYDFIGDNLLGWEYLLGKEYIFQTEDITSVPEEDVCQLIGNVSLASATSLTYTFSCTTKPNMLFGIITLLIPFLPGIQWYATLQTKDYRFGKFITSLLFPFFMIFFKVIS